MRLYGTSASINLTDSTLPEREKKGLFSLTDSLRAVARLFRSFILSRTTQRLRRLSPKLFLRYFHEKKETETEREKQDAYKFFLGVDAYIFSLTVYVF